MKKTGRLTVDDGVLKLAGTRVGVYHVTKSVKWAMKMFESVDLQDGDEVSVEGELDYINDEPVLVMAQLSRAGGSLGGPITPNVINVTCKQCGFVNQGLPYIDFKNLPACQNPTPPRHRLKVF